MTWSPWPGGPQNAGGGGGAQAKPPQLQPVDASVVAAWKSEYVAGGTGVNGMRPVDYSGNGNDGAVSSGLLTVPDQVPGRVAAFGWLTNPNNVPAAQPMYSAGGLQQGMSVPAHGPATELLGDMTFTATLAQSGQQGAFSLPQYIYAHGDAGTAQGISFGVGISGGSYNLFTYWEGLNGINPSAVTFGSAISQLLRSFLWSFMSVVRDTTAKTVTLGINGTYETKPYTVLPPSTNPLRYPFLGAPPSSTGVLSGVIGLCGPSPNQVIRNVALTQAQCEAIRKTTMGG